MKTHEPTVTIPLADLRSILDDELSKGIPSHDFRKVDRHRRLTFLLVEAERTSRGKAIYHTWGPSGKIAAIKAHRSHFGSSLREAKAWVEGDFSIWPREVEAVFARELEATGAEVTWPIEY
jgi:hypothetical protein